MQGAKSMGSCRELLGWSSACGPYYAFIDPPLHGKIHVLVPPRIQYTRASSITGS